MSRGKFIKELIQERFGTVSQEEYEKLELALAAAFEAGVDLGWKEAVEAMEEMVRRLK